MKTKKPARLLLAEATTRYLPPIIAQRVRTFIFPLKLARQEAYRFKKRAITGSVLIGNTSDLFSYPFSVHGYYNWRLWACAIAICNPGDRIIEIGANVGTETIGFSDIVGPKGQVVAFEPYPPNFELLAQAISLCRNKNVELMPFALADDNRVFTFSLPTDENSGVGHIDFAQNELGGSQIQVQGRSLDTLGPAIGSCSLISMDAEGSEISILRGAKNYMLKHRPSILLEADGRNNLKRNNYTLRDLYEEVSALGYLVWDIGRFHLEPIDVGIIHSSDWVAVPDTREDLIPKINAVLRKSALLPPIRGINPLVLKS